jgi:hypothetical protein
MNLLIARDPTNPIVEAYQDWANPKPFQRFGRAAKALEAYEKTTTDPRSVLLFLADFTMLRPDLTGKFVLESFISPPKRRTFLVSSASLPRGEDYVKWLHRGVSDVFLPETPPDLVRDRMEWALEGWQDPFESSAQSVPDQGEVYLVTTHEPERLDLFKRWVDPALRALGYTSNLIKHHYGPDITSAENSMAKKCAFAIAHVGKDGRPGRECHNLNVHGEIRTLFNESKVVFAIRDMSEEADPLPDSLYGHNCHHYSSSPELARWLYKTLQRNQRTHAAPHASGR